MMHISNDNTAIHSNICANLKTSEVRIGPGVDLFSLLAECMPFSCLVFRQNNIVYIDPIYQHLFGSEQEDSMSSHFLYDFVSPEYNQLTTGNFSAFSNEQLNSLKFSSYRIHPNGNLFPISIEITTQDLSEDILFITNIKDFSENQNTQSKQYKLEVDLESPNQRSPEYIILLDINKNILYINAAFESFSIGDTINNPIDKFVSPEHGSKLHKACEHALSTGKPDSYDISYTNKNGNEITYQSIITPLKKDTKVYAFLLAIRIKPEHSTFDEVLKTFESRLTSSESTNKDNSLRQSEKRFRAIFERSAAGIAVVDLDGHLTVTNPALQNMLGYSESEIANMVFLDYTHPDDVELNWQLQQEIVTGKRDFYKMEKRCIRKNGEIIWCSVNVSAVHDESGSIKSVIGVLEDITQRKLMEENLRQSTAKFKAIYNSISDAAIFVDTNYRIVTINPAVSEIFGYSYADLESKTTEILHLNNTDYESKKITHFNANISSEIKLYEMEYRRKDGAIFVGETQGSKIVDETGSIIGYISIIRDISDRKKAEERLRLSQKIFEDTAKAILITDAKINIIDVNDAFCSVTGYSREEVMGKKPNILQSGLHDKAFYEAMWHSLLTTGIWQGEIWDKKKNGELFPNWATISTVKDGNGLATNYVSMLTDISHLKETEKRLEQLAHFDQLTGLPNRMIFHSHLKNSVNTAKKNQSNLAVIYIDLDGFKQINDSLGHTAGDKLLCEIGKRLKHCVFEGDTVARLGGDEFAIIMNNLSDIENLHNLAKRIVHELSISLYYEGKELRVTGSVGIATYPNDGECENTLLRNADHAMYYAKQSGKSTYQLFASDMNKKILERIHLEADLRRAIKNREFFILFQPKLNLSKRRIVGVEALVRWNHPERGILLPQDFISFAEDSNLIIEIGQQVINQACQQAKIWNHNRENKIPVAINISVRQFKHGNIVKEIKNSLNSSGLPAYLLEIELTESLVMDNIQHTVEILEELKAMGIKISIDDFGTGYSSLNYLKRLPVDNLKIDRSFVLDITESDDDRAIISAILSMAKSLNLHVIAEGVENTEQLEFLSKHHCHEIQGFLISPPISFELLEDQIKLIESQ